MKKTYKADKSINFGFRPPKPPVLTHSMPPKSLYQFDAKNKSQRQVKVICPNCQYHFKIQLKLLLENQKKNQETISKPLQNIQKLIEHQFSLISNYSRSGNQIQNSPVIKLKNQQNQQVIFNDEDVGLQRLHKLNEMSELQKSRLQDSKVTVRFNPSPQDSPIDQYEEPSERMSQHLEEYQQKSPQPQIKSMSKIYEPSVNHVAQEFTHEQKQLVKQKMYDYFEMMQTLTAVLDWIRANEHYNSLPSYIRFLINGCQQKLNIYDFD